MPRRLHARLLAEHEKIRSLIDEVGPRGGRARLASIVSAMEAHCASEARRGSRAASKARAAVAAEERWLLVALARRLLAEPGDRETRTVRLRNLRSAFVEHCTRTET